MSKQLPLDHPFQQYTVNLCTIQCFWLTAVINRNSLYPPTYWSFNYLSCIFLVSLYAKSLDCKREASNSTLDPRLFFTACPTGQDRQIASVEESSSIWLHKNSLAEHSGEVILEYYLHLVDLGFNSKWADLIYEFKEWGSHILLLMIITSSRSLERHSKCISPLRTSTLRNGCSCCTWWRSLLQHPRQTPPQYTLRLPAHLQTIGESEYVSI